MAGAAAIARWVIDERGWRALLLQLLLAPPPLLLLLALLALLPLLRQLGVYGVWRRPLSVHDW